MIKYYNVFNSLMWIFLIYVVGDVLTTYLALPYGTEGNSVIAWVLATTGFTGLIVMKLLFMVLLFHCAEYLISRGFLNAWKFTAGVIIIMGAVIMINNLTRYFIGIGVI